MENVIKRLQELRDKNRILGLNQQGFTEMKYLESILRNELNKYMAMYDGCVLSGNPINPDLQRRIDILTAALIDKAYIR